MNNFETPPTPSARAQVIAQRTYSRPLDSGGFESWEDIVARVCSHQRWLWQRALGDVPLNTMQEDELEELRTILLNREACVSGRTLWLGGTDVAKSREASMFNPCHPDTKFVTDAGVKSFRDFNDGDVVTVLTHRGNWKRAVVSYAGVQPVYEMVFKRGSSTQVERFSSVHRWLLADGETRVTTLEVLDKELARAPFDFYDWDFDSAPIDEQVYWASGYIYGDGSVDAFGNARVRLCGKDKELHLVKFQALNCPYSYPPSANQDVFVYFGKYGKVPPSRGTDPRLVRAFVHGYLAADGSKCKNSATRHGIVRYAGMLVANTEAQEFVRWAFPMVGIYITSETVPNMTTNFGPRKPGTVMFRFATMPNDWRVKTLKPLGNQDVWCLTVEDDETFVLPNGIVTSNCAFTKVETIHDVVDAFWLLLQGCGVGFEPVVGTLNGFTQKMEIEIVRSQRHLLEQKKGREYNSEAYYSREGKVVWHLTCGDSAEAWAKFVGKLLAGKRRADVLVLDFSQIRPAGERLKGYGWISSGDETFAPATKSIAELLNARAGELLARMDILDVLNHLGTTLSSRRSAEIALVPFGDPEWQAFALAKKDFWLHNNHHRQQSNNSLLFKSRPDADTVAGIFDMMQAAGGSEPGFINAVEAKRRAPWFSGCNPCVPGDTQILTDKGYIAIESVVGKSVNVWNGKQFSTVTPFSTGENPLVRVTFSDGTHLDCTPYHTFVLAGDVRAMAEELRIGDRLEKFAMPVVEAGEDYTVDAYSQGFYSGDGNADYGHSWVYEPKAACMPRLQGAFSEHASWGRWKWTHGPMLDKNFVPVGGSLQYCLNWFAGLLDSDGTVTRDINGNGLQITSVDKDFLLRVRLMLTRMGVRAKVVKGHQQGLRLMPNGLGGVANYMCQETHRLLVGNVDTYDLMQMGLKCERLKIHSEPPQRDARRFITVTGVVPLDEFVETFCFTEPLNNTGTFNGIVTGQCAEILLPNKGFCNLVEINLSRFNKNPGRLWHVARIIARANYRQTCVNLDDGVLQRAWHENNEFLRLCGVGVTGVVQWEMASSRVAWDMLKRIVKQGANSMADELGLPQPKAVTTVKPSGTLSKIMDTTEGVHKPLGRYIFNNVRFGKHDPLLASLRAAGYRVFDDPSSPDAQLVTFPVEYPGVEFDVVNGVEVNTEPAVDQLERYKLMMQAYVDYNCSVTISYSPEEVPEIVSWLNDNWDNYVGVSFLYRTDPTKTAKDLGYLYLPQEVVTKEVYEAYVKNLRPLGRAAEGPNELVREADDYEIDTGSECSSGMCPVR